MGLKVLTLGFSESVGAGALALDLGMLALGLVLDLVLGWVLGLALGLAPALVGVLGLVLSLIVAVTLGSVLALALDWQRGCSYWSGAVASVCWW